MPVGATFRITAEAEQPDSFEVEHFEREIIIWAWPSSIVKVFSEGDEVGISAGVARPAVPSVPEGQCVSSFLRSVLGKERMVQS
jgi:hypothetical protein